MNMEEYLEKRYGDKKKKKQKDVTYRSNFQIVDKDNYDIKMGRLVEDDDPDEVPVIVENKFLKIDPQEKEMLIKKMFLNQAKEESKSDSSSSNEKPIKKQIVKYNRQRSNLKTEEKDDDSDSDLSLQRNNQQPVYRDSKTGQRIAEKELTLKEKQELEKKKVLEENKKQIQKWSTGLVQKQERAEKLKYMKELGSKDDQKELDLHYIGQDKFDDPMRKLIRKEEIKSIQHKKESSFHIKCKFPSMPNRFDIEAGHMWDGVDRSNGYEIKYISGLNSRKDNALMKEMDDLKEL